MAGLALGDLNRFNYAVPDAFNAAQDDSRTPGGADDYLAQFGPGPSPFHQAIGNVRRGPSPLSTVGA